MYQKTLNSWNWTLNPFASRRSTIHSKIEQHKAAINELQLSIARNENRKIISPLMRAYAQQRITQREKQCAMAYLVARQTQESSLQQASNTLVTVAYQMDAKTVRVLQDLGLDANKEFGASYTGTLVQQQVHKELLESLDKISETYSQNSQANHLLKTALAFNNIGRQLNTQHNTTLATLAKKSCDAFIDCAKTIVDVSVAVGEGAAEGTINTFHMLGAVGKGSLDAVTFPEETIERVRATFNNAVLATSRFFNEVRKDVELLRKNDEVSSSELDARLQARGDKVVAFLSALEKKYQETSFHDKVKAVSRNITEFLLLAELGGAFFEGSAALADIVKLEAEATALSVKSIIANPTQALAKEVVELAVHTAEYEPAVIKRVLDCIEIDGMFAPRIDSIGTSVSEEVAYLLPNKSGISAAETVQETITAANGINQTCNAVLVDGYYEVNGFKFSEYYYNYLWGTGRKAPSLTTKMILEEGKLVGADTKNGFLRYETFDWEMIYNPITREVWHLQPIK